MPEISVGSLVTVKAGSGKYDIYEAGERGVCYDVRVGCELPAYLFIFEGGGYDAFPPDEVAEALDLSGRICAAVADYRFTRVGQLRKDFGAGRFSAAFQTQSARLNL